MKKLLVVLCMGALITACGDDQGKSQGKVQGKPQAEAPASAMASAPPVTNATVAKEVDGGMFVDHTRDIKEFQLRRSLFGVETLINSYKEQKLDISELESQKADLVKQINALISG